MAMRPFVRILFPLVLTRGVYTNMAALKHSAQNGSPTWSELLACGVDADFRFSGDGQLLGDLVSGFLGDGQCFDQRLILDQRASRLRQVRQQIVLQLLHLTLVGRDLSHQLRSLSLQVLSTIVKNVFSFLFLNHHCNTSTVWNTAKPVELPTKPSWSLEARITVDAFRKPTRMCNVSGQISETCNVWTDIRAVLHQTAAPEHTSATEDSNLCNNFINFFNSKIQIIKSNLISQLPGIPANNLYADRPHRSELLIDISLPSFGNIKNNNIRLL